MPSRIDQPGARCVEGQAGGVCPEKVEFFYDGENKRSIKTSTAGNTYYVGKHFELHNGIPIRYIFAGDLRLAKITPAGIQHYHRDHLMSTVAVTDEIGNRIESADYIPFGQTRNRSGINANAYRYTDQEFDWETGLYNYKARLYDPLIANFMSADPNLSANLIVAKNGSPFRKHKVEKPLKRSVSYDPEQVTNINDDQVSLIADASNNLNRYAYVNNNPLKYTDPNGFLAFRWHFLITFSASMATERGFSESLVLAWQTMAVDFGSQGTSPEETVKHAMGTEKQSAEQAISDTKLFIQKSIDLGNMPEAIHAAQDLATPGHAGQPWTGFHLDISSAKHLLGDIRPSDNIVSQAYKDTLKILQTKNLKE
jgi:RHS repeat-associated protein